MSAPSKQGTSPVSENLNRRWRQQWQDLENYSKLRWDQVDPETVHDVRVLSRRLRAIQEVLLATQKESAKKFLPDPARKIRKALGSLRSWDVSLECMEQKKFGKDLVDGSLEFLVKAFKKRCDKKREGLELPALGSPTVWENLLHKLSEDQLKDAIQTRDKALVTDLEDRVDRFLRTQSKEDLHQIRIALKRWRYHQEIIQDGLEEDKSLILKEMKAFQDRLGQFNDWVELSRHLKNSKLLKNIEKAKHWKRYRRFSKKLKRFVKKDLGQLYELMGDEFLGWVRRVKA